MVSHTLSSVRQIDTLFDNRQQLAARSRLFRSGRKDPLHGPDADPQFFRDLPLARALSA